MRNCRRWSFWAFFFCFFCIQAAFARESADADSLLDDTLTVAADTIDTLAGDSGTLIDIAGLDSAAVSAASNDSASDSLVETLAVEDDWLNSEALIAADKSSDTGEGAYDSSLTESGDSSGGQAPFLAAIALLRSAGHKARNAIRLIGRWTGAFMQEYRSHFLLLAFSAAIIFATLIFFLRYENRRNKKRFMTTTRLSVMDKEVQRAAKYIEKNYADSALSVESLSAALITGPAFLEALFERELGISVDEFISQVRVNRTMGALETQPERDLSELAAQSGFKDDHAMRETFQRITGTRIYDFIASQAEDAHERA